MRPDAMALAGVAFAGAALAPATAAAWLVGVARKARLARELARVLADLGVRDAVRAIEPLGGGRSNAVWRLRLADHTIILKRALPVGTVLAFGARWAGPQPFALDVRATARVAREARALRVLRAAGVKVPRVLAADPARGVLLLEDLAGLPLPRALAEPDGARWLAAYARAIRAAHAAGVVLTDGHAGNALACPDGAVALLDLEFAELAAELGAGFDTRRGFDLAYAAMYLTPAERARFLAAAGDAPGLAAAQARVAGFAPLFDRERARQRAPRRAA
ncbi:MAG: phosphotransferase [Deltaproteobacteria bacterium]|nr:phosphotransferase [Deltaproteobacteria bacterium]